MLFRSQLMVFSDVDVQFFAEFAASLECLLGQNEIVCQAESPGGTYCTGLFVCRSSPQVVRLWEDVSTELARGDGDEHDQDAFNRLLRSNRSPVRCGYLPYAFFGGGTLTGTRWFPGDYLPIPATIVLHHANFTVGVPNKVAQLTYVRQRVETGSLLDTMGVERIVREWRQKHLSRTEGQRQASGGSEGGIVGQPPTGLLDVSMGSQENEECRPTRPLSLAVDDVA